MEKMFGTKTEEADWRKFHNKRRNNLHYSRNSNLLVYQIKENGKDS